MNETSGLLVPVVQKYLEGEGLDRREVKIMQTYLRQWVGASSFHGREVDELRRDVEFIRTTAGLRSWLNRAVDAGIDPL
jgi:hypothetical protein